MASDTSGLGPLPPLGNAAAERAALATPCAGVALAENGAAPAGKPTLTPCARLTSRAELSEHPARIEQTRTHANPPINARRIPPVWPKPTVFVGDKSVTSLVRLGISL